MASKALDLSATYWRKSSYSNASGGDCVEVADTPGIVPVRDSKRAAHDGPVLLFDTATWAAFVTALKH